MSQLTNIAPTTELDAVNTMLAAIGEAPIDSLDDVTATDVVMAVNMLRAAAREVLSLGWRFNMEWGFEIAPSATVPIHFRDGSSDMLNVFVPPDGLVRFRVTACIGQIDSRAVDVTIRKPRRLDPATYPTVFYDRANNYDGLLASQHPFLYIDPVWFVDYEDMPEEARRYIAVRAARQFAAQVMGSAELSNFSEKDETYALRTLKRYEGQEDDTLNVFDNMRDTGAFLGGRAYYQTGVVDPRNSKGLSGVESITVTQSAPFQFSYGTAQFVASGLDAFGSPVALSNPVWSCSVGTVDQNGLWSAPSPGFNEPCTVTVTSDGMTGSTGLNYLT